MASEWVGVVGTAIGASIGGVVTVASAFIRGRQDAEARREASQRDDLLRDEDRSWSMRTEDLRERRTLYRDMLDGARDLGQALGLLASRFIIDPSLQPGLTDAVAEERQRVLDAMRRFVRASSIADLIAIDPDVLRLSRELNEAAVNALAAIVFRQDEADALLADINRLSADLTNVCRRELGYDDGKGQRTASRL